MKRHDSRLYAKWADENGIKKKGMTVRPRGSDAGRAIQELKKRMVEEGMIRDMRQREYYESKGEIRRRKNAEAIRRFAKERREEAELNE